MRWVGLLFFLCIATPCFGDAGSTAAAMPDQATRCRYLKQTCDRANAFVAGGDLGGSKDAFHEAYEIAKVIRANSSEMDSCIVEASCHFIPEKWR